MRQCLLNAVVLAILCTAPVLCEDKLCDLVVNNANATKKRIETTPVTWSVTLIGSDDSKSQITVQKHGALERWTYFTNGTVEAISIIVRDGFWYVEDRPSGKRIKFNSYEAFFSIPSIYSIIAMRNPTFLTAAAEEPSESDGSIAVFRTAVTGDLRKRMEYALQLLRDIAKEKKPNAADRERMKQLEDALAKGTPTKVDVKTGLILEISSPQFTRKSDISFDKLPPDVFEVSKLEWDDQTSQFKVNDQTVLLRMNGDPVLLNLKTMERRRVPDRSISSSPGCILRSKASVVMTSWNPNGFSQLIEIDLRSRESKTMFPMELGGQICINPEVSGNSKIILGTKGALVGSLDLTQPYLIDLDAETVKKVGDSFNCVSFSWLPDNEAVITAKRYHQKLTDKTFTAMLCRLDLDGKLTELCPGDHPVVLPQLKRILFQDPKNKNWSTCAFDGKDIQSFGDGFSRFSYPVSSLDGTRLLMIQEADETAKLMFVDPVSFQIRAVFENNAYNVSSPHWR